MCVFEQQSEIGAGELSIVYYIVRIVISCVELVKKGVSLADKRGGCGE